MKMSYVFEYVRLIDTHPCRLGLNVEIVTKSEITYDDTLGTHRRGDTTRGGEVGAGEEISLCCDHLSDR